MRHCRHGIQQADRREVLTSGQADVYCTSCWPGISPSTMDTETLRRRLALDIKALQSCLARSLSRSEKEIAICVVQLSSAYRADVDLLQQSTTMFDSFWYLLNSFSLVAFFKFVVLSADPAEDLDSSSCITIGELEICSFLDTCRGSFSAVSTTISPKKI